jgi:hypothetical protein
MDEQDFLPVINISQKKSEKSLIRKILESDKKNQINHKNQG